jgi:23S rRNA pseudouridine2605 synthase
MKRTDNFDKFASRKKNSAIKEEFRQEKKKFKKERSEAIEKKKLELRAAHAGTSSKPHQHQVVKKTGRPSENDHRAPIIVRKEDKSMPLNKYVAHCGVCSRRDAVALIKEGKLKVNDIVVTEPGFKVEPNALVFFSGKRIFPEKNLVYILLNKPKDYITTSDDPEGRKTVLDLIKGATIERVFPIGRLDRNTTGVLLLTNDGDMTQKLSHPSHEVRKIYEVKLDKPLGKLDFERVLRGLELEDGFVRADALAYSDPKDKSIIGIELHSGRNRIVRRIFESLGYDVRNLDRVMFGNLTKKNVERGKWRFLNEKEIRLLKFMNSSFIKKSDAALVPNTSRFEDFDEVPELELPKGTAPEPEKKKAGMRQRKTLDGKKILQVNPNKPAGPKTLNLKGKQPSTGWPQKDQRARPDFENKTDQVIKKWEDRVGKDGGNSSWGQTSNQGKPVAVKRKDEAAYREKKFTVSGKSSSGKSFPVKKRGDGNSPFKPNRTKRY